MAAQLLHSRSACLQHAGELIEASAKLLDGNAHPHISYHLSLLALEEIGKACMLGAKAVVGAGRDSGWMDKWLSSHPRKLQWAIWSPMDRIDPADFEEAKRFAESVHARRLSALYVDPDSVAPDVLPRDNVTTDDAASVLELARTRLNLEDTKGECPEEADEVLTWYLQTIDDPEGSKCLFSKPFVAKFEELGDTRTWVVWAKAEMQRIETESADLLKAEMARSASEIENSQPRWQTQATVYTPSHSLRPKVLNYWNDKIDIVKLIWTGKKDQFLLQITLPDAITVTAIHDKSAWLAKLVVACLNMGSIGYFWFQRAGFEQPFLKDYRDFENPDAAVRFEQPGSFWGDGRAVALDERHMQHVVQCMLTYARLSNDEAEPIFRPYFDGLAFIAKSDAYYSLDDLARRAFASALAGALHRYGEWDGTQDSFWQKLHLAFEPFMPEQDHRDQVFDSLKADPNERRTSLENLRNAKHLADLYLVHIAANRWRDGMPSDD